jgi:GT2 family glycosyltransferase
MTVRNSDASVVICAFTEARWDSLLAAVDSLRQQEPPPREIIVVIDHNQPMHARVKAEVKGVVAVENGEPQGLSGARNSGIGAAQGRLIAFLDDDATAEPDWLALLSRQCDDQGVLGASGKVEPAWLASKPSWFPEEFYWVLGCSYRGLPQSIADVRNLYGGCSCIKREVFESIGGFRSGIGRVGTRPLGGEETELCIRARQHFPNGTFRFEPGARIHHEVPPSRARWAYFCSRCFWEGFSKAIIAHYVGTHDGLASERSYTFRTLPRGVMRGLADTVRHRDLTGILRGGAIVAGLAITTFGYVVGNVTQRFASRNDMNRRADRMQRDAVT